MFKDFTLKYINFQENTIKIIKTFFIDNRYTIIFSSLILFVIYSAAIFHFKFGIDFELMINQKWYAEYQWKVGRPGNYILDTLLPFFKLMPVAYISFILIGTIACTILLDEYKFPNFIKIIFNVLFLSCFNFLYMHYFTQYFWTFSFNILNTVFLAKLIKHTNYNYKFYIIPIILLMLSYSTYPIVAIWFILFVVMDNIIEYINNKITFKTTIKQIFISGIIAILSLILYFILLIIDRGNLNIRGMNTFDNNITLLEKITLYWDKLIEILSGKYIYFDNTFTVMMIIMLISFVALVFKQKNIMQSLGSLVLLIILMLTSILSIILLPNEPRIHMGLSMLYAFPVVLSYLSSLYKYTKILFLVIFSILIFGNINQFATYNLKSMLTFQQDIIVANRIINQLYDIAPNNKKTQKVLIIGRVIFPNEHNMLKNDSSFGASFFEWDGGNPSRISNFLYLLGLSKNYVFIKPNVKDKKLKEVIEKMPSYPSNKNITKYKDIIIIKLSPNKIYK